MRLCRSHIYMASSNYLLRVGGVARVSRFSLPVPELRVPRPCVLGKGGYDAACTMGFVMPRGLHRTYGAHHLHFITTSCYRRLPFLRAARSRDTFLAILEQTRERYRFVVVGYVVLLPVRSRTKRKKAGSR